MDDGAIARRVPQVRMVFNQIVTDANDDIGIGKSDIDIISCLQADSTEGIGMLERDDTFGHEGIGEWNIKLFGKL